MTRRKLKSYRILFKKQGKFYSAVRRHGFLLSPSLFKPGTCLQVCHSWLDQESRVRKRIVTMKYKEDTSYLDNVILKYLHVKDV
ncbi:hypothetical protein MBAV_006412 [Candidatus Magnetobacterium bavaricum]|uniref:Uncharacterized protein n=1 Tax=Candidatus Magnetobacterium bavaricum TaxID=29290 RepID=A0A0F3GL45_9BACT|nr:hypothetical protein MBAV_006412 [Candidatus Magnetobacterium bavaricum]